MGIYYSHDMGNNWASIPGKYVQAHTWLVFYSTLSGELAVPQLHYEERSDYYHTVDSGKNWIPGPFNDAYKTTESAGFRGECPSYYRLGIASPSFRYEEYGNGEDTITVRKIPVYRRVK